MLGLAALATLMCFAARDSGFGGREGEIRTLYHLELGKATTRHALADAERTINRLQRTIKDLRRAASHTHRDVFDINCPNWPDTDEEYEQLSERARSKLDPKMRFIFKNQNPQDCSTAKFLLFRQETANGLGAQLAPLGTLLLVAAAHNRVLLPVYSLPERDGLHKESQHTTPPYDLVYEKGDRRGQPRPRLKGWKQAGCALETPQCYWLPLTKCQLSEAEVTAPHTVMGSLSWNRKADWEGVRNERIVEANPMFWGTYEWLDYPLAFRFLNMVPQLSLWPDVQKIAALEAGEPGDKALRNLWAAATRSYLTRYNAKTKKILGHIVRATLPADFNPDQTISLMLRGSDKCGAEGGCLPLERYMQMAETIRKFDPTVNTIILTSEDPNYFLSLGKYPSWRFVLNKFDVKQGSGDMHKVDELTSGAYYDKAAVSKLAEVAEGASKKDLLMYSMLSSLQLQLRGKYLILNCASNWHKDVFSKVLYGGCGYTRTPLAFCVNSQVGGFLLCDQPGQHISNAHPDFCKKQKQDWEDRVAELKEKRLGKGFDFESKISMNSFMEALARGQALLQENDGQ